MRFEGHPLSIGGKEKKALGGVEINKKVIGITFLLLYLMLSTFAYADNPRIVPGAILILPQNSRIKIKWIIEPSQRYKQANLITSDTIQFVLDYKNTPFISYAGKILMNPITGYIIKFDKPLKQVISLDNGAMIFSDGENLAYPHIKKSDKHLIPVASLKSFLRLPLKNSSVYSGDKNSLYAAGYNEENKKYEIFLFYPEVKSFKIIAVTDEKINALTGSGAELYIATGRQIKRLSNGKFIMLYEHPREEISGLFYSEKTGLFYKTFHGVGFVKNGYAIEFLQIEHPEVFLKGTSLYVFLSNVFALMEFINIDDLKRYNFRVEKIVKVKSSL